MPTQNCNIVQAVLNKDSYNKMPCVLISLKTLQLLLMLAFVVQFSSVVQSCQNLCGPMDCSTPGFPVHQKHPEFAQTHVLRVSDGINHLILSHPLLLLPSIFPSIRVFSNDSVLRIRWPKYWNFSISPSNEYSGLISFRIALFDLPAVQGTLKSLLQHHSSKASILQCSAFFMVQLSHPYMTIGKTRALTRWTFVSFCCIALYLLLKDLYILLESLEITLKNAC